MDSEARAKIKLEIKTEKNFLKNATALITGEDDSKYFKEHKKFLQAGEALADTEEKLTLVLAELVQLRNKAVFLLFRKGKLTPSLTSEFHTLPSIEDMMERVKTFAKTREERQAELKKLIDEAHEEENRMDIFKAVCNGMSEEKAKEELARYEDRLKQAMQGK